MDPLTYYRNKVQRKTENVVALAESGCDAGTLSLIIADLREAVTDLAYEARATRKGVAS